MLVIETAPGVVAQAVMHVVLLVRKVVQVVPEQECEVGEVVRHKMSQEWHKAVVTVGRVDVLPGWLVVAAPPRWPWNRSALPPLVRACEAAWPKWSRRAPERVLPGKTSAVARRHNEMRLTMDAEHMCTPCTPISHMRAKQSGAMTYTSSRRPR